MNTEEQRRPPTPAILATAQRRALVCTGIGLYLLIATGIGIEDTGSASLRAAGVALLLGILLMADGILQLASARSLFAVLPPKIEQVIWAAAVMFQLLFTGKNPAIGWLIPFVQTAWPILALIVVSALALAALFAGANRRKRWLLSLKKFAVRAISGLAAPIRFITGRFLQALLQQAGKLHAAWDAHMPGFNQRSIRSISIRRFPMEAATALRRNLLRLSVLMGALALALIAAAAAGTEGRMRQPLVAMIGWAAAIGLVMWAGWKAAPRGSPTPRRVWLTAGGLFLLALLPRIVNLNSIPIELRGDEAVFGFVGIDYITGRIDNPFALQAFLHPGLFGFAQSWLIRLFGQTEVALRLLPALIGAVTVPAIYLMGRALFNERTGLFAGLFLAAFHYHIHYSRLGLNQSFDGLAFTAVLAALYVGWKQNRRSAFLLAGIGLGLAQYFYMTARALLLLIPLWVLLASIFDFQALKRSWSNLMWMLSAALVVYMPLTWIAIHNFQNYMGPVNTKIQDSASGQHTLASFSASLPYLIERVWQGLLAYTTTPPHNWYEPGTPLLRTIPAALFIIGIVILLNRWKDSRSQIIVLWLLAFGAVGGLSENTPSSQRYAAVAPALALVVGFSVNELRVLGKMRLPKARRVIEIGALILMALLVVDDARFYFADFTPRSVYMDLGGQRYYQIAKDLQHEPNGQQAFFFCAPERYNTVAALPFLTPQLHATSIDVDWNTDNPSILAGEPATFIFLDNHENDLLNIQSLYPGGELSSRYDPNGHPWYWIYRYRPR